MNQGLKLKTILIISIVVLAMALSFVLPANAVVDPLVVQFEKTPLFNEVNFLPGESISRWVKVTNNSGETQRIAVEAINESDPDNLGNALTLEIKEGGSRLYDGTLSQFFNAGEVYLSDLAGSGSQTQYDFIVTFYSGGNNAFQEKTLGFDILIGFQGTEGGLAPGGGSGGGGLPSGLTIQDESVRITEVGETNVTLIWTTSYFSTSQVIYGAEGEAHTLDLNDNIGSPPKYGYKRTTSEYDVSPKVTSHSVTITDLTPGTTYYFRAISHGSLAISREYSFKTLETKEEQAENIKEEFLGEVGEGGEFSGSGISENSGKAPEGTNKIVEGGQSATGASEETNLPSQTLEKDFQPKKGLSALLASIGGIFGKNQFRLLIILLIIILVVLAIIWFRKRRQARKKEKA